MVELIIGSNHRRWRGVLAPVSTGEKKALIMRSRLSQIFGAQERVSKPYYTKHRFVAQRTAAVIAAGVESSPLYLQAKKKALIMRSRLSQIFGAQERVSKPYYTKHRFVAQRTAAVTAAGVESSTLCIYRLKKKP